MKTNQISAGYAPQLLLSQFSEVEHKSWHINIYPYGNVDLWTFINGTPKTIHKPPFDLRRFETVQEEIDGTLWTEQVPVWGAASMIDVLTRFWDFFLDYADAHPDFLENEPPITFYYYDGSVYQWDFTLAHYCFAEGRLSEEELVESLRVVPAGKEA